jgi:hypothetical protein
MRKKKISKNCFWDLRRVAGDFQYFRGFRNHEIGSSESVQTLYQFLIPVYTPRSEKKEYWNG